jgi:hypothetical protein
MGVSRWIRLDLSWSQSEWLADLEPAARLAWVELLGYVKANGVRGRCKAPKVRIFSRLVAIPMEDVEAMMAAGIADGALEIDGAEWIVVNWDDYQTDKTAAERQARRRAASTDGPPDPPKSEHPPSRDVTRNGADVTRDIAHPSVTPRATVTLTGDEASVAVQRPGRKETSSPPPASVAAADGERAERMAEMTADLTFAVQDMPAKDRRVAFRASASGVVSGDDITVWRDVRGDAIPWADRPRLLRLALEKCAAEQAWGSRDLRGKLKLAILQQLDPLPPKAIPPDAPARQIGAELPQHHGSRTAAGLERPGQSIRDERREQEDRERAQDESVASWCRANEAKARQVLADIDRELSAPEFDGIPASFRKARERTMLRERVLAAMSTAGAA